MKRIKPKKLKRIKPKKLKRKKPRKSMETVINLLRQNVRAYHKTLGENYVNNMSLNQLLAYCHPIDRTEFVKKLKM